MLHYDPINGLQQQFNKKGGGGGGTTTQYVQSPEARQVMESMMPAVRRMGSAGSNGKQLWDVPSTPGMYDVPSTQSMMPTYTTMGSISPEVRASVMSPYIEVSRQLMEELGSKGQLGSARGGFSGTGAAGLGKYWADVAPEYTKSLWGMVAPAQAAGWQAELNRRRAGYNSGMEAWRQQLQSRMFPYQAIPGMAGGAMPTPVITQSSGGKK